MRTRVITSVGGGKESFSLLKKVPTGLNDFKRSSFHSENLPVTMGNKSVTGLKPPGAAAGAASAGIAIDVAGGELAPIRFAGSIWLDIPLLQKPETAFLWEKGWGRWGTERESAKSRTDSTAGQLRLC